MKSPLMNYYDRHRTSDTLKQSDSDSAEDDDNDSFCSSDDDDDDDDTQRPYHVGGLHINGLSSSLGDAGLATINEDTEEDGEEDLEEDLDADGMISLDEMGEEENVDEVESGEGSGHWMFSADNTDTDSVVHVPMSIGIKNRMVDSKIKMADHSIFKMAGVQNGRTVKENSYTENCLHPRSSSEDTLVASEEECDQDSNLSKVNIPEFNSYEKQSSYNANLKLGKIYEGVAKHETTNKLENINTNIDKAICDGIDENEECDVKYELSDISNELNDVFDFDSLENCETVSNSGDEKLEPSEVDLNFNTSATSLPFTEPRIRMISPLRGEGDKGLYAPQVLINDMGISCSLLKPDVLGCTPSTKPIVTGFIKKKDPLINPRDLFGLSSNWAQSERENALGYQNPKYPISNNDNNGESSNSDDGSTFSSETASSSGSSNSSDSLATARFEPVPDQSQNLDTFKERTNKSPTPLETIPTIDTTQQSHVAEIAKIDIGKSGIIEAIENMSMTSLDSIKTDKIDVTPDTDPLTKCSSSFTRDLVRDLPDVLPEGAVGLREKENSIVASDVVNEKGFLLRSMHTSIEKQSRYTDIDNSANNNKGTIVSRENEDWDLNCRRENVIKNECINSFAEAGAEELGELNVGIQKSIHDSAETVPADQSRSHAHQRGAERDLPSTDSSPIISILNASARGKQRRPYRQQHNRIRSRNTLRHRDTSEGDTDDTDGDFDDEQFLESKECHQESALKESTIESFNSSGVIHTIGGCDGIREEQDEIGIKRSGTQDAKDESEEGISPSKSPLSNSVNRGVERLSEESEFGDKSAIAVTAAPLASIRESEPLLECDTRNEEKYGLQLAPQPVVRANQASLARPRSLVDLRYYYSTETDSDDEMNAFIASKNNANKYQDNGRNNYRVRPNHSYTDNGQRTHTNNRSSIGAPGLNSGQRSSRVIPQKPRRHQSLYTTPSNSTGTPWHPSQSGAIVPGNAPSRRNQRPKPLSLDMAEEFLSQEGLDKSPLTKQLPIINKYLSSKESSNNDRKQGAKSDKAVTDRGIVDSVRGEMGINPPSAPQCHKEVGITTSSSTPDLTDQDWLCAHPIPSLPSHKRSEMKNPQSSFSAHADQECYAPRCSVGETLEFVAKECFDESDTKVKSNSIQDRSTLNQPNLKEMHNNGICEVNSESPGHLPDIYNGLNRVKTKTYGPHGEVEIFVAKNSDQGDNFDINMQHSSSPRPGSRGVTFSPSVKEVNWRESYLGPDDTDYFFTQLEEKEVQKVTVMSSQSPVLQKYKPTFTSFKPAGNSATSPDVQNSQFNGNESNRTPLRNDGLMLSNQPDLIASTPISAKYTDNYPSPENSPQSDHASPDTSKHSAPIWQRLKLVKVGSPKGPRPKIPPKPPSLSPRSSDGESSKISSPESPPDSELSSPSSPDIKFKKIPTSPRFFSWGSKRGKKATTTVKPLPPPKITPLPSTPSHAPPEVSSTPIISPSQTPTISPNSTCEKNPMRVDTNCTQVLNTSTIVAAESERSPAPVNQMDDRMLLMNQINSLKANPRVLNGGTTVNNNVNGEFFQTRQNILLRRGSKNEIQYTLPSQESFPPYESPIFDKRVPYTSFSDPDTSSREDFEFNSSPSTGAKPPRPPSQPNRGGVSQLINKTKLLHARRQYFNRNRQSPAGTANSPSTNDVNKEETLKSPSQLENKPNLNEIKQVSPHTSNNTPIDIDRDEPPPRTTSITPGSSSTLPAIRLQSPAPASPQFVLSEYRTRKSASERLKERFEAFSSAARADRVRLARSTPDLSEIASSVRRQHPSIDRRPAPEPTDYNTEEEEELSRISDSDGDANDLPDGARLPWQNRGRPLNRTEVRNTYSSLRSCPPPPRDSYLTRSSFRSGRDADYRSPADEFDKLSQRTRTRSVGLLETDIDTGTSKEFLEVKETNLDKVYQDIQTFLGTISNSGSPSKESGCGSSPGSRDSGGIYPKERTRAKSLLQLDASPLQVSTGVMESCLTGSRAEDNRAKSMEFLLDDDNRAAVQAPENELMKEGTERKASEAELRVRRSLQRLDVPEWMKTAQAPKQGFILKKREPSSTAYPSSTPAGGWSGFSSKNGSMTSLGSSRANTPNTPTKVVIPTRTSTRNYGTYGYGGGVTSPSSNASISPTASDRTGGGSLFQYPLSRWSTSKINHSGTATPTGSLHSQRSATTVRQPYLGWRSNTSLATLGSSQSSLSGSNYVPGNSYLSPAERLALSLLPKRKASMDSAISKDSSISIGREEDRVSGKSASSIQPPSAKGKIDDVQSSIKEVTSAIVHYCTETPSPQHSPRLSPRLSCTDGLSNPPRAPSPKRKVWVESSFVGSRPISSPETPLLSTSLSGVNGHSDKHSKSCIKEPPEPPRRGAPQPPSKYVVAR